MKIIKTAKYRENYLNQEMTFCNSCQEANPIFDCPVCKKKIKGQCEECHMELVHGEIENSNIQTFRNDLFHHMDPRQRIKMKS